MRTSTDQIIAHAALLRAVDQLLESAEDVRLKREELEKAARQAAPEKAAK